MRDDNLHTSKGQAVALEHQGVKACGRLYKGVSASLLVIDSRPRTCSQVGLSHLELPRLTEGMDYLSRQGAGVFFSISACGRPEPRVQRERIVRDLARDAKSRIALYQRRAKMRRVLWLQVNEAQPEFNIHIVAPFPSLEYATKVVEAFNGAEVFLRYGPNILLAEPVDESLGGYPGLTKYLAGEATPQAHYKAGMSFPRVKGSYPLGVGGGDRVIPSPALEAVLLRRDHKDIQPRRRTYAKCPRPSKAMTAGEQQLHLFPHLAKPVARLGEHLEGVAPQTVAMEVQFLRKQKGFTQDALAQRAGVSRPQLTNWLQGRFGMSAWHVQRIREALAA